MSGAAAKPLLAILIFLACSSLAFGQAGSTGGTIGKTDKSVSGGEAAPETQTQTKSRSKGQQPADRGRSDRPSVVSVAGRWRWIADCPDRRWEGEFDLSETSPGHISGSFAATSWYDIGTITGDHINASSITFTRNMSVATQYWTGRLAAGRIKGTISSGGGTCSWEATKK